MHDARMAYAVDEATVARVAEFLARVGSQVPRRAQRASFATYAFGILGEGARKSVEPIAARASVEPEQTARAHDRLLHFLRESPWDDRRVRREAARYVTDALSKRERITTWIVDDTGFLKQGRHSPGVQRQYTGSAGKITNCQIGVSLTVATATDPQSWIDDARRRKAARIPDAIEFKTKTELAIGMIERAVADKVPGDIVLADSFYGRSGDFRRTARAHGLDYAVAIDGDSGVILLDAAGRRRGEPVLARDLTMKIPRGAFRRVTWRDGTKGKLSSRFVFRRVRVATDDELDRDASEAQWLVIEWPDGEREPTKYFLTTLRRRMSKKQIVRTIKERWKTEQAYEELKGELGLDHFEGRSFVGWHHHVSVVLCCYAFVVAERVRTFPPSNRRADRVGAFERAA
jgi:SRSO17 transposase